MLTINKFEKDIVSKELPHIHIVRTMKTDSKRHHYYMAEEYVAVDLIAKLRGVSKERLVCC